MLRTEKYDSSLDSMNEFEVGGEENWKSKKDEMESEKRRETRRS